MLLQVLSHFGVGLEQGLSEDSVEKNRLRFGRNELPSEAGTLLLLSLDIEELTEVVNDGCPTIFARDPLIYSFTNFERLWMHYGSL